MKRLCVFLALIAFVGINFLHAQTVQITGTVTSAEDGMPIPGVSVQVKGTTIGTSTDAEGKYSLSVPQTASTLIFTFIGMKVQEIDITGRTAINVILEFESQELDEVMIIAYGTTKRESFTGSAKMVGAETLEKRTVSNITKALDGIVAGVQTTSGGGQPGSGSDIRIRGFGSINASNAPLYVVDGIPFDGNINAINPDDIASVTVLKDASASALYGARGANGVIIITTKRGSSDRKPEVRFKAIYGNSSRAVPTYETVNQAEYMELMFEAYRNQLLKDGFSMENATNILLYGGSNRQSLMNLLGGEIYNPFNIVSSELFDLNTGKVLSNAILRYNHNWFDEATRDNPFRSDYQFSVNGGSDNSNYLFSFGYLDDKGIVKNSYFKRFSTRLNLENQVKEWFKAGLSTSYSTTKQNYLTDSGTSYNNIWYSTLSMAPIYPVYATDEEGNIQYDDEGNKIFDYGETRPHADNYNTIATLVDDSRSLNADNLSGRTFIELDTNRDIPFIKDLKFTMNFGFDYRNSDRIIYRNPYHGDARGVNGDIHKYSYKTLSYTFNQLLSYNKSFDVHNIDLLLGHEYYDYGYNYFYATRQGIAFPGLTELDGATTTTGSSSYSDTHRIESYLSRFNYNYADRYYFSASYRTDGSSRFHKDYRWGKFWSLGASWRISEESFMNSIGWLNNMTLKASYGAQGNEMLLKDGSPDYYAWQSFYSTDWANGNLSGVWLSTLENKKVLWEKNLNFNVGVDARLFDRFSISAEYFIRTTDDLLLWRPLALSTGFDGFWDNIGSMDNKGVELDLFAQVLKDEFKWSIGTMFTKIKNEVTKLVVEGQEIISGNYIITVGEPINSFFLPSSAGIDPETGAQLYYYIDGDGISATTNDYNLAAQHKSIKGSRIPDFYGSVSNNFSYKGFDLSILLTYSVGGKILDGVYNSLFSLRSPGSNLHKDILKRWQNEGDETNIPKLVLGEIDYITDDKLFDASYLSIKNISFGYTLPARLSNRIGVHSTRVFFSGDNLALFTKLQGMDPQYNFAGSQNFNYVPLRILSLGIDINF